MSRRFPPPWSVEEFAAMSDTRPMTPEQAATLKQLAKVAYELDAFKPNLRCAEADIRIAMLKAKLKLLDGPPHTCQSASKFDPLSASNFDPLWRRVLAVAIAPSEVVGVAETARAPAVV